LIEFLGHQKEIEKIYKIADILVLTSEREGTPNVVMEAMATGLPVISTNVGGIPDIVYDSETGFLIEPGDIDSLVSKLMLLMEDTSLRQKIGTKARKFIVENHSLEMLPSILFKFYSSILDNR
jgi:glycosyltransferase involved in cell wall biosynthesis